MQLKMILIDAKKEKTQHICRHQLHYVICIHPFQCGYPNDAESHLRKHSHYSLQPLAFGGLSDCGIRWLASPDAILRFADPPDTPGTSQAVGETSLDDHGSDQT